MAWGTHAERRAAIEDLATKAEARAQVSRAQEASSRARGKEDQAGKFAAAAARQERIALNHRQEIERLDARARRQAAETVTRAERAYEMARAQERAAAAAAAQAPVDPLQAYTEALQHAATLEADAARFEKNARAYTRAGDKGKAAISTSGVELSLKRAREWRDEADRIQADTTRNLARELRLTLKARQRDESRRRDEERRLEKVGVHGNPATAAGQRAIASGGAGRGTAVASLQNYANLIRKPQERTRARLETMEKFDTLCGKADAGLFPEQSMERESSSGHGPGETVMANRIAGLAEMDAIRKAIGAGNADMLRAWIYDRQTLTALVRAGYGTEKTAGALVLAAVDSLTKFFTKPAASSVPLSETGSRSPTQSSTAGATERMGVPALQSASETPNSVSARASRSRPETRQFWSNYLPPNKTHAQTTLVCREEISDDMRSTIRALSGD